MRLRIAGGQARGLLRLAESAGQVSLANKRVRKVHVRLHKIRFQAQRFLKLANGGIDLFFATSTQPSELWPSGLCGARRTTFSNAVCAESKSPFSRAARPCL